MTNDITILLSLKDAVRKLEEAYFFHKKIPLSDKYKNLSIELGLLKSMKLHYQKIKEIEDNNVMPMGIFITVGLKETIQNLTREIKEIEDDK
jgi:hypothetical protein